MFKTVVLDGNNFVPIYFDVYLSHKMIKALLEMTLNNHLLRQLLTTLAN